MRIGEFFRYCEFQRELKVNTGEIKTIQKYLFGFHNFK